MIEVSLCRDSILLLFYSYSEVNLYILNLGKRENYDTSEKVYLNNFMYYTQKHKLCLHTYNSCFIFQLYPVLIWVGTIIISVLFSAKNKKKLFSIGGSEKDAIG